MSRALPPDNPGPNRMRDAKGRLTPYALACGYIEVAEYGCIPYRVVIASPPFDTTAPHASVTLSLGGCYHVRLMDHSRGERVAWLVFRRLPDARRAFVRLCKRAHGIAQGVSHAGA